MKGQLNARAEELLAERALRALDDKEHWELQQMGVADDESFDLAAASIVVATTVIEPMPAGLMDKILAAAPGGSGGLDWRRTLPGVAMPLPDSPRDTIVSVSVEDVAREIEKSTEPLIAQKPVAPTKAMPAALDTLPPPMRGRAPAIPAPSLVDTPDVDPKATTLPPEPFVPQEPQAPHVRFAPVLTPQPQPAKQQPAPPVLPAVVTPIPDGRTPMPQDSSPFSVEQPPMAVPITRDRTPSIAAHSAGALDDLAKRRQSAETVPLKRPPRVVAPWLAAAACLLVAGGAVFYAIQQRNDNKPVETPPVAAATPAAQRSELMANAKDVSKISWTVTQDATAKGATGDVVWSAEKQKGFMRFVGLAVNDPKQFQYQLWIFDKTRDQAFPVDGGVFDVTETGEIVVPISAKLHVNDLALFAVTVEKPGGVVVSKRERIVVTAART